MSAIQSDPGTEQSVPTSGHEPVSLTAHCEMDQTGLPGRSLSSQETGRVLLVIPDELESKRISAMLRAAGYACDVVTRAADARILIDSLMYDVMIVSPSQLDGHGMELRHSLRRRNPIGRTVVVSQSSNFEEAVQALRAGAVDFIPLPAEPSEFRARIAKALQLVDSDRRRENHLARMKNLCRRLHSTRNQVVGQIDTLCTDLADAYQEMAEHMTQLATVAEFSAIIRQELDIEELLRTVLEYVLRKIGPTNAAIYLPDHDDEFSLGAYVNYDCPKDTVDYLLDHLAGVIAPRLIDETRVLEFTSNRALEQWIGEDATWLSDSHVLAFGCHHNDECLAAIVLFRDTQTPFDAELAAVLGHMSIVLARQLAQIIHVHNRHLPDEERAQQGWQSLWQDDCDDDLDDDYGGGMAA
ncbi:MAG: response regulator [Planctomycetes bacterium]|nr:response regulator [Planctomycetota bacterium]